MNYRTIEPVGFWSPAGIKNATRITLYNFHGYNFDGTDSLVSYKLQEVGLDSEGEETVTSLSEGSVAIPNSVVQAWGIDDEPIFDFVLEELNLEKI